MDLEQKIAAARKHRGVRYDKRIDKFTAEIVMDGERKYLGSHATAEQAGRAYAVERASRPITRKPRGGAGGGLTIDECYQHLMQEHASGPPVPKHEGLFYPDVGDVLRVTHPEYPKVEAQEYTLIEVRHRRSHDGKQEIINVWAARCCADGCNEPFTATTWARLRTLRGITRTCEAHRDRRKGMQLDPATVGSTERQARYAARQEAVARKRAKRAANWEAAKAAKALEKKFKGLV